ncbi:hypothetical protein DAI22_03g158300 [Oryza sativa Japonica Group]|nr:hypothetical protein DAI22_03g158300 [Oryza sativa Japonica Group]
MSWKCREHASFTGQPKCKRNTHQQAPNSSPNPSKASQNLRNCPNKKVLTSPERKIQPPQSHRR